MKFQGLLKDLSGISRIKKARSKAISEGATEIKEDNILKMTRELYPGKIKAKVTKITKETSDSVRIRFSSPQIPLFKAGTYLTIEFNIGQSMITRPYSIITSPIKAYKDKYVEIIVKDYKDGFASQYLCHDLKENDEVILEVGLGRMYYKEIRDGKNIVAIAGGAGITPFISMAHDIIDRNLPLNMTILYGSDNPNEIIAKEELDNLNDERIKVIYVISGNYPYEGEKGFINQQLIEKYSPKNATYYICGPKIMFLHVKDELIKMGVNFRRVRKESFSTSDVKLIRNYPLDNIDKVFNIEVHQGIHVENIKARGDESIATALERAGLKIHTACRSGFCGYCRIKVLNGTYFIPEENDGRRYSDKEFNYVYSCSTYPTSDLVIKINI